MIPFYRLDLVTVPISDDWINNVLDTCTCNYIVLFSIQAPTYHIILEVLLVLWIIKLLFFSERYHPNKEKDKPTKEVSNS